VHISGTGPVEDVAVLVEGGWAAHALKHRWHPSQTIEIHDDAKVTVRMRVRLCPELETWALTFGEHATVLRPAKLREAVATRLARVAQRYEKEVQAAGRGKLARR
jgi:predicted DNA-binding transcriptional regulator YafY